MCFEHAWSLKSQRGKLDENERVKIGVARGGQGRLYKEIKSTSLN